MRRRLLMAVALIMCADACTDKKVVQGFPDHFVGIGLELRVVGGFPVVVRVLPDGAAAQSDIQPGDRITAVDGKSTAGRSLGDVVVALRGEPDSQVTLSMDRRGERIIEVLRRESMARSGDAYRSTKPGAN